MNEIEELKAKIEELNKQFAELLQKQEIKEEKLGTKVWKPTEDEICYNVKSDGNVITNKFCDCELDRNMVNYGNYFDNEEQAQKQAEFNRVYNRFRKYVEAYSEPLDWESDNQEKYQVAYNCKNREIYYPFNIYGINSFTVYASSEQVLRDAMIYSAGSEKEFVRIVFGVEE